MIAFKWISSLLLCLSTIFLHAEESERRLQVVVSGGFDDIKSPDLRFLEEASKLGELSVCLWTDETVQKFTGKAPKFPLKERLYFLNAVRYVSRAMAVASADRFDGLKADIWADVESTTNAARIKFAADNNIAYRVFRPDELQGFPLQPPLPSIPGKKKVIVTGCYDWFHSGHIRFFEEAAEYGELYVMLGNDANIEQLKGKGHPLILEDERRYVVSSIKFVTQAAISSGFGLLDADLEIKKLKPDIYAVNEDGDKGGKREYCQALGIEYKVLKRTPAPGLPARSSTDLRGF